MAAGYSKRPLVEKLGIKGGAKIALINTPTNYLNLLGYLPEDIDLHREIVEECDFIHFFTKERNELESHFEALKQALVSNGMLWISWPKRTSKIPTDLDENIIRNIALANGLVDVKVCAVDEIWSGLKLVYRLKDRK